MRCACGSQLSGAAWAAADNSRIGRSEIKRRVGMAAGAVLKGKAAGYLKLEEDAIENSYERMAAW